MFISLSYVALARTAEDIKARIESSQTDSSKPLAEEKEKLADIMARMEEAEAQLAKPEDRKSNV